MSALSDGKAWLAVIVETVMRRVDYHALYVARVVTQHGDGTIDVVPDTDKIPPMTEVPIRYGLPGISAKVKPGARVLIGFEGGEASRPIATVWESAAIEELRITSDKAVIVVAPDVQLGDEGRPTRSSGRRGGYHHRPFGDPGRHDRGCAVCRRHLRGRRASEGLLMLTYLGSMSLAVAVPLLFQMDAVLAVFILELTARWQAMVKLSLGAQLTLPAVTAKAMITAAAA